jgi:hypothetical protein
MGPGVAAARLGHDVIMLPTSHCYFDYYQSRLPGQPKANGRYIPLETVYAFEPVAAGLTAEQARHVLGAMGCLWTEYMPTCRHVEYMAFPRTCAMAEVLWSPKEPRDLADFKRRLKTHFERLDGLDLAYFSPPETVGQWLPQVSETFAEAEWDVTDLITGPGIYEAIFLYNRGEHGVRIGGAALLEDGQEIGRDTHEAFSGQRKEDIAFRFDLKRLKPGAGYALRARLAGAGGTDSAGSVLFRRVPPALDALLESVSSGAAGPGARQDPIVLSEFQVWADAAGPEVFEELNKIYLARGRCHSFDLYPRYDYFVWSIARETSGRSSQPVLSAATRGASSFSHARPWRPTPFGSSSSPRLTMARATTVPAARNSAQSRQCNVADHTPGEMEYSTCSIGFSPEEQNVPLFPAGLPERSDPRILYRALLAS